jgi:hypothetical protein
VKTYVQLFWNLLIALFVIGCLYFGYETVMLREKVEDLARRPDITVGTDERLRKTVDELETSLKERSDFVFTSRTDPLELSRVVISKNIMMDDKSFLATLENTPRLSAIISGPEPQAIIRLKSRNHVVKAGDRFEGYQVADIGSESVRIHRGGSSQTLRVEAASKDLARRLADLDFDF